MALKIFINNENMEGRFLLAFLFLLIICAKSMIAQDLALSYNTLNEYHGLIPSDDYFVSQGTDGLIFIGTSVGLQSFDGHGLSPLAVGHNDDLAGDDRISSFCYDDALGNVWYSSYSALHCYNRASKRLNSYHYPGQLANYYAFHLDQTGKIWLRIGQGELAALWIFDPESENFDRILPLSGRECTVLTNNSGEVERIIQTQLFDKTGLEITDTKSGEVSHIEFSEDHRGNQRAFSSTTSGCVIDKNGTIWTGIYDGLGYIEAGSSEGVSIVYGGVDLDFGYVNSLIRLDENRLLLGTNLGLYIYDIEAEFFTSQTKINAQTTLRESFSSVISLGISADSTLWVGEADGGIAYSNLAKNRFTSFPETFGTNISALRIGPENKLWCSTEASGVFVFDHSRSEVLSSPTLSNPAYGGAEIPLPAIDFFLGNSLDSWWGNMENNFTLWQEEIGQFQFWPAYFFGVVTSSENRLNYCFESADTKLVALGRQVYELILEEDRIDTFAWHSLEFLQPDPLVFIGQDDNGYFYLGDESGRLIVLDESETGIRLISDIPDLGIVYSIHQAVSDKHVWISSSKGLSRFNPTDQRLVSVTKSEGGLPKEPYYNIIPDENGNLWLPGRNGLTRYDPDTKFSHRFTTRDGLMSNIFNPNASLVSPATGDIYVGTKAGLHAFNPSKIALSDFRPPVHISDFLVNDEPYDLGKNKHIQNGVVNINERKNIQLNYRENTLSFQFVALEYSAPESNAYFYQMEGVDEERVSSGTRNFVRYANIPAGNYTFKIWATNSDGVLNPLPKTLGIEIIPPIYQRWWFYLASLIFLTGIIYGVFKYRLAQALKVERLRVKISSDLHDDVGGMLSGLAMQTELLELTASEDRKPKLQRISEISRSAMSRMRDTVWAIDARKDQVENLLDRMHEHAAETLASQDIRYQIELEQIDPKAKLPTDLRQNLYLIYKEAITNVAKHSNGDRVNVLLSQGKSSFRLYIHDNGEPKDKAYKTTGLGIDNLRMRAEQIGAELTIDTSNGYAVELKRPGKMLRTNSKA